MEFERWRDQLAGLGGNNPLSNFEPSSFGQVDLTRAHPGGLAQLSSARVSTVSNLVRDGVAQSRSLSAARRIRSKTKRIRESFGLESCYIAGGLVVDTALDRKLPILLWHTNLIPKGDDYEVRISAEPKLNPELIPLFEKSRPDFRQSDLLALAVAGPDLIPVSVLAMVAQLLDSDTIELEKPLVLGNFLPDLSLTKFPDAPAGFFSAEPTTNQVAADPVLVTDADSFQIEVIRKGLGGESFAVETLPGAGYIQTVINLLANLALQDKRVLLVAPREQTLDEIAERLSQLDLGGLAIRNTDSWADAVAAISRHEKATDSNFEAALSELRSAQVSVENYFESVSQKDQELDLSLTEALGRLAELSALPDAPTNSSRLRANELPALKHSGQELVARAYDAGVFRFGPQDTAWFGSRFANPNEIAEAVRTAKALAGEEFRTLSYQINRYLQDQNLIPCANFLDWSKQLSLLIGIRQTLDKFLPSIYDRPLTEMIAATAPRSERGNLSGAQRRRFKKLAKEYQRTGVQVPNLHLALVAAEEQRGLWLELNTTNAPPAVPLGLNDVQQKFERILGDLERLQKHLDPNPEIELLTKLDFDQLAEKLNDLAAKTEILDQLLEREPLVRELVAAGLGDFVRQVCSLSASRERALHEFELCWWSSALEAIVSRNPTILEFGATEVSELEAAFEKAAGGLVKEGATRAREIFSKRWKAAITKYPAGADELRNQLRTRKLNIGAGLRNGPVFKALAPAVMCAPLRVHELGNASFDTVLVLDAAYTGVADAALALSMAPQLIAFGDPVISAPENFDTIARPNQGYVFSDRDSVFDLVSPNGKLAIVKSYRTESQVLGQYLNQNFYQNRLVLEPSAAQFFGSNNFEHIEIIEGSRASSTIEGATESLDAEVAKVTELVLNHARWTPDQSLMVVTPSRPHVDRVTDAVQAQVMQQPQLAEFFDAHGREKFEVLLMSEITHRIADRVIFSVGFGRTPEGRISGTLGDFNAEHSVRWMVNQIVSARKRLTVVSCYNFEDFAAGKLPENQLWLKDLIAPSFLSEARPGKPDPLLQDLALRLQKLGLKVELNFAGRISLAVANGNRAAVVDPDWALTGANWDERLRLRPGLLRAMGWDYLRVHALEIFAKPQEVANRIGKQLGLDIEKRAEPLFEDKAFEDTSQAWGDPDDSNDDRLRDDKPPHWG